MNRVRQLFGRRFGGGAGAGDLCGAIAGGILVLGLHYGRLPGKPRNARLKELCRDFYQQAGMSWDRYTAGTFATPRIRTPGKVRRDCG